MGWSFGKKQSYELLMSSILISILIFLMAFVITDLIWVSSVVMVVGFIALTIGIFPLYLPKMISYLQVNLKGIEYYNIGSWKDRIKIIFEPNKFQLSCVNYRDMNDISVITARQNVDADVEMNSKSGVLITKKNHNNIFVDVSWYDTVDNPIFDRAMEFVQSCTR
ncbi:hypothetical protein [Companilactobacillus sp. HBUAS59699]|uniref:hypothetical protein n=1 Tax=Companilactobacillus sp. HBUAS59699 TaxID=3109358 RepID=UPI002FF2330B